MRFLLLNPSFGGRVSRGRYNRAWPPLDLLNCAAILEEAGHRVKLIDQRAKNWADDHIHRLAQQADIVILTTSPLDRWQCPNVELDGVVRLLGHLPKKKLILSGVHGTLFSKEVLALTGAAGVIRGQPEGAVLDLAAGAAWDEIRGLALPDGRAAAEPRPIDLDALPPPAYHLINLDEYAYELLGRRLAVLEAGRGCPWRCAFCLKAMYPAKVASKSGRRLLDEVERVVRDHRAESIYFIDLEFTARREVVEELCQGLIARRLKVKWCCQTRADTVDPPLLRLMRQAGCALIHFGVESASAETMADSGKRLELAATAAAFEAARRAGIATAGFFMVGLPGEGRQEARRTLSLAKELAPDFASFHAFSPYPTTAWGAESISLESWAEATERQLAEWSPFLRRVYLAYYLRPLAWPRLLKALAGANPLAGVELWWRFLRGLR